MEENIINQFICQVRGYFGGAIIALYYNIETESQQVNRSP